MLSERVKNTVEDYLNKPESTKRIGKTKTLLLGNKNKNGLIFTVFVYTMLISLGFIYLYPILHMAVTSVKSLPDLLDVSVNWIPTKLTLDNFKQAFDIMNFSTAIWDTLIIAILPSVSQTAVCALTGYGFARFNFPSKKLLMVLMLVTFIVPPYVTMVPTFTMFSDYGIIGTLGTLVYPALTGQGMKSAIFVLIFMQFFKQTPPSLDEAARVDGCGELKIFIRIALPLAIPAFVVAFLFSFVWYWNETYFTSLYLGTTAMGNADSMTTLLLELSKFEQSYKGYMQSLSGSWGSAHMGENVANEAIKMAATLITIMPMLILYFILQKQFVESIDKTGITGE